MLGLELVCFDCLCFARGVGCLSLARYLCFARIWWWVWFLIEGLDLRVALCYRLFEHSFCWYFVGFCLWGVVLA